MQKKKAVTEFRVLPWRYFQHICEAGGSTTMDDNELLHTSIDYHGK